MKIAVWWSIIIFAITPNKIRCKTINVSDLPKVFYIDDDSRCKSEGKTYCQVSIQIQSNDRNPYWKIIEKTIKDPTFYNHNNLFHSICVQDFCPLLKGNVTNKLVEECYRLKYSNLDLDFLVSKLNCEGSKLDVSIRLIDAIALFISIAYVALLLFATYTDGQQNLLKPFSIKSNWRKLRSQYTNPDFENLKFLQGIRFYNMLLIIFCHTLCSFLGGYVDNTDYFEVIYSSGLHVIAATLAVFLVQTFFLLAAFLLAFHSCQVMQSYQGSKWRYVALTLLNRYLRILPPVFVMILLTSTTWIIPRFYEGPLKPIFIDPEFERCTKNWWTNLLFISNHYNPNDMCYFITWYLSADTQLYAISLLILLIIWKFPEKTGQILGVAMSLGIVIPMAMCFWYSLDVIYRLTPENSKLDNFRSFHFNAIYTSTYTNMGSYMVGLALGCFYFALTKKQIIVNRYRVKCMMVLFALLPASTVLISSQYHSQAVNVLISGLVKPCYALGVGAGIVALSQQANKGIIKRVCEWRPVLFLSNFTYSTYVVQYGLVFYRTATTKKPFFVSDQVLLKSFLQDAILSIICGFLMHILIEMPALQLQKLYIPQIKRSSTKKKIK